MFRGQRKEKELIPSITRLDPKDSFLKTEENMFNDFKRTSLPLLEIKPDNDWDWLALAQHHGMATRLLDWSRNPFAALWFAVEKPPAKDDDDNLKNGIIWIFKPEEKDIVNPSTDKQPFKIKRTKVFQPKHITKRIVAQAGWFTAHKYMSTEKFIPLENNKSYTNKLLKLTIPAKEFSNFRYHLDRFNVNSASIYPDIDGLCKHIQWINSKLEDEK